MVIVLYSDAKYEYQVKFCIDSLQNNSADLKILYFTLNFDSSINANNIKKVRIDTHNKFPCFNFYKTELCIKAMEIFPEEENFIYSDSDVIFSSRFNPRDIVCDTDYPLASFGPHELPFTWEQDPTSNKKTEFNHYALMEYFGIQKESQRYVWSCFYSYNRRCLNFFTELLEIYNNAELMRNKKYYFPFNDETPFNICLWKYSAKKNLGFAFVNTHLLSTVVEVEGKKSQKKLVGSVRDAYGYAWEYIHDPDKVIFYHGCKDEKSIAEIVDYIKQEKINRIRNIYKNDQSSNDKKIAIVTLYDKNYEDFAKYSVPNKLRYANIHKYDLIVFNDSIDKTRPPQWSKIKAVQSVLSDYDWVWWIDIDSMIMNFDIKLESIIDDQYEMIFTSNAHSYLSNGSSFYKNTDNIHKFLAECYDLNLDCLKNINVHVFDHEQQPMRILLQSNSEYKSKTKFINERSCNSFCKTNNPDVLKYYPNWNSEDNLYQTGDFVIQFCGRTIPERLESMFEYILPTNISVSLFSDDISILKSQLDSIKESKYNIEVLMPRLYQKFNSFSQLVNYSVNETSREFMIFVNPKTMVNRDDIDQIIKKLHCGYCFVGLVGFGLFGCTKQLFREVGLLDERFLGGEYEDNDFALRLKLLNKAVYAELNFNKYNYAQAYSEYNPVRCSAMTKFYDKWNLDHANNTYYISELDFKSNKISYRHGNNDSIKYSWYSFDKSTISSAYNVFNLANTHSVKIVNANKVKRLVKTRLNIHFDSEKNLSVRCDSDPLEHNPISCHVVAAPDSNRHNVIYEQILCANTWCAINLADKKCELRIFHVGSCLYKNVLIEPINITLDLNLSINVYE